VKLEFLRCNRQFRYLLTTTALSLLGGPIIHSFAFALLVGLVIGTYSSMFVSTPIVPYFEGADAA
jgi:preprotein translocase subunit SecF